MGGGGSVAKAPIPGEASQPSTSPSKVKSQGLFSSVKNAFSRKQPEAPPPLTTALQVFSNEEALLRVKAAVEFAPPSTVFRWEKLLKAVNRIEPQVDPKVFPVQMRLDQSELKKVLVMIYDNVAAVQSDGIALMRDYLPKMYDMHSVELARRVSQKEREENNMYDECYAYGELDFEIFATIYFKVSAAFGVFPQGCFYDLGSGVGQLVYAAVLAGMFSKCAGIEAVKALHDRANLRIHRWNKFKLEFPRRYREVDIIFSHDNFFKSEYQTEATFILLHWTAFTKAQREVVVDGLEACREGTIVVALTHPIHGETYELLKEDSCDTSWGHTMFYIQEKLTSGRGGL